MNKVQKAVAEFIGTYAIVFAGCGSIMISERFPNSLAGGTIPLVFGLVVACMIYTIGHISGAHMNPSVTLAFTLTRHFPKNEVAIYWISQFMGAVGASLTLQTLLPMGFGIGETVPAISNGAAFTVEFIMSFYLMFVVMAVSTDTRAESPLAGMAIGGIVAVCAVVGGPLTGASMNPARSFGPAIVSGQLQGLWIYLLAPTFGMTAAAFLYQWIRKERA